MLNGACYVMNKNLDDIKVLRPLIRKGVKLVICIYFWPRLFFFGHPSCAVAAICAYFCFATLVLQLFKLQNPRHTSMLWQRQDSQHTFLRYVAHCKRVSSRSTASWVSYFFFVPRYSLLIYIECANSNVFGKGLMRGLKRRHHVIIFHSDSYRMWTQGGSSILVFWSHKFVQ